MTTSEPRVAPRLDPGLRRRAERRASRQAERNRLRRVRIGCHGWLRDPAARVGDWLWCDGCADWRRVEAVAE